MAGGLTGGIDVDTPSSDIKSISEMIHGSLYRLLGLMYKTESGDIINVNTGNVIASNGNYSELMVLKRPSVCVIKHWGGKEVMYNSLGNELLEMDKDCGILYCIDIDSETFLIYTAYNKETKFKAFIYNSKSKKIISSIDNVQGIENKSTEVVLSLANNNVKTILKNIKESTEYVQY